MSIQWECVDCGYIWAGNTTDSWCPNCDEHNITSPDLPDESQVNGDDYVNGKCET